MKEATFSLFGIFLIISISKNREIIRNFLEQYRWVILGIILGIVLCILLIYTIYVIIVKLFHILRKAPNTTAIIEISSKESEIKETILTPEKQIEEDFSSIRDINIFLKKAFPTIFKENEIYWISWYLRLLHPKIFEEIIQLIFKLKWFEIIKKSKWKWFKWNRKAEKDWWIDLICKKDNITYYIQAKSKVSKPVTDDVIRNLHWSTINQKKENDKVIIITTTFFSDTAIKTAKEDNIDLIDFEKFNSQLDIIYKDQNYRKNIQQFFLTNTYHKDDKYLQKDIECPECWAPLLYRENNWKIPYMGCVRKICWYRKILNTYNQNRVKPEYYHQKQYQYH